MWDFFIQNLCSWERIPFYLKAVNKFWAHIWKQHILLVLTYMEIRMILRTFWLAPKIALCQRTFLLRTKKLRILGRISFQLLVSNGRFATSCFWCEFFERLHKRSFGWDAFPFRKCSWSHEYWSISLIKIRNKNYVVCFNNDRKIRFSIVNSNIWTLFQKLMRKFWTKYLMALMCCVLGKLSSSTLRNWPRRNKMLEGIRIEGTYPQWTVSQKMYGIRLLWCNIYEITYRRNIWIDT